MDQPLRVDGLGGAFFRARDPVALARWYETHLGVSNGLEGETVWQQRAGPTVWAPFPQTTEKFGPEQAVMFNFRVGDLTAMLGQLREAGVDVDDEIVTDPGAGRFAWLRDPEGNTVELWEPEAGLR